MHMPAKCALVDGRNIEVDVDLDYVDSVADVFDYINNDVNVQPSWVRELKNEDDFYEHFSQ